MKHLLYCPFTGLGKFNGFRGNSWLRNRIKIFKHFVVPSLLAQSNQNFVLWVSWRPEEKHNPQVKELFEWLDFRFAPTELVPARIIFTYSGVCFWDDKYSDEEARSRLSVSLHHALPELSLLIGETEHVLMTIQPSDDCYHSGMVEEVQGFLSQVDIQACGYRRGYVCRYATKELAEYNPLTIPPFFTIKFPRLKFVNRLDHLEYTGPYKSHEYIADKLKFADLPNRGFLVGTHGENISTVFDHPFKGADCPPEVLKKFGIFDVEPLKTSQGIRRRILNAMPYRLRRKIRFWCSEKLPILSFLVQ